MSASTVPGDIPVRAETPQKPRRELRVPHGGWRVIAAKELGDDLLSIRFIVLLIVLGLAALVPLYAAADQIRQHATEASGTPAIFLALFILSSPDYTFLQVASFVSIIAPLLGLAFAFDAINGERSEGTLPRLLAQPIYRDDVINGKFAAGLAVIGIVLVAVIGIIAGFGIFRLGIVPAPEEILRLVSWILVTFVYVGLWLAFGLLLSVLFRRAATSALIGFGVWFLFTTFGPFILDAIGNAVSPLTGSTTTELIGQAQTQQFISRLLPGQLYSEVTAVLLNPTNNPQATLPGSLGQAQQAQQQIPTLLAFDQSVLLVWPQVVVLVAMTVACFALAYVAFMRQEVRA
ncbi:MAG TPA: ABC transporter permease subunit [Candidatus Limnocylindrales bacterium]